MKNITLMLMSMIAGIVFLATFLEVKRIPDTNCFKMPVPVHVEIYSESNSASNIVTELQPNDLIIFCGDKK
jgi:hypothetical protein